MSLIVSLPVPKCQRCGGSHPPIEFRPFILRPVGKWTHWAICPENGEPLLASAASKESQFAMTWAPAKGAHARPMPTELNPPLPKGQTRHCCFEVNNSSPDHGVLSAECLVCKAKTKVNTTPGEALKCLVKIPCRMAAFN